jgi:hypothetical protein
MPSPFPGMNPYLEQEDVWHDFHERFLPHVAEWLVPQVRPAYIVKLDEHIYIHELPAEERRFLGRADDSVTDSGAPPMSRPTADVLQAPAYGRVPPGIDVERHAFIEIHDRRSRELVTVVELLSPSNKRAGADREQYLAKRWQLVTSPVHLVEIDLLRGGPRLPLEDLPECDYYVLVSRAEDRPRVGLWPLRLRDRLPVVPVPLRAPTPDARIDLQEVLNRLYDAAGYQDYIYTGTPQPPLHPQDAGLGTAIRPTAPVSAVPDVVIERLL